MKPDETTPAFIGNAIREADERAAALEPCTCICHTLIAHCARCSGEPCRPAVDAASVGDVPERIWILADDVKMPLPLVSLTKPLRRDAVEYIRAAATQPATEAKSSINILNLEVKHDEDCWKLSAWFKTEDEADDAADRVKGYSTRPNASEFAPATGEEDSGEGPTGCMDDGDELSQALRGVSQQDLTKMLDKHLRATGEGARRAAVIPWADRPCMTCGSPLSHVNHGYVDGNYARNEMLHIFKPAPPVPAVADSDRVKAKAVLEELRMLPDVLVRECCEDDAIGVVASALAAARQLPADKHEEHKNSGEG